MRRITVTKRLSSSGARIAFESLTPRSNAPSGISWPGWARCRCWAIGTTFSTSRPDHAASTVVLRRRPPPATYALHATCDRFPTHPARVPPATVNSRQPTYQPDGTVPRPRLNRRRIQHNVRATVLSASTRCPTCKKRRRTSFATP